LFAALALVSCTGATDPGGLGTGTGNGTGTTVPDGPGGDNPGGDNPGGENPSGENPSGSGETIGPLSPGELSTALAGLPANTAANPHTVKLDSFVMIDTRDYSYDGYDSAYNPKYTGVWATVNRTVGNSGKYVILDLSECSAKGNKIDGDKSTSPYGCQMNIIANNQYIKGIVLPDSLTRIEEYSFYFCERLTSVTIPAGVTSIGTYAILGCDGLNSATMPAGLADDFNDAYSASSAGLNAVLTGPGSVADDAFDYCTELISVTIGSGVTGIGEDTFDHCPNLTTVNVDEANSEYSSVDGVLFNKDKTSLLHCPEGRSGGYSIPQGVISIGYCAFENCSALTGTLSIPSSVTSIEGGAFSGCSGFTGVLSIPLGITSIGSGAFYKCEGFTGTLAIPQGVTSIGSGAFSGCTALTSVIIPESVTRIGIAGSSSSGDYIVTLNRYYGAFEDCTELRSVIIPVWLTADFALKFSGYTDLTVELTGTGSVPDSAFTHRFLNLYGTDYYCNEITSVVIGDGVTGIGQSAFSGCTGLTSVNIPDGITTIEQATFSGCTGITNVTIGDGVKTIGAYAFSGCTALKNIFIPNSVDEFQKFLEDLPIVGDIIEKINSDGYVDGVSTIGSYAFSGCTDLTSVTFGGPGIYDHNHYLEDLIAALEMLLHMVKGFTNPLDMLKAIKDGIDIINDANNDNSLGFYDNAFPQGSGAGGNALKTAYMNLDGGTGTYTRTKGNSNWKK
jgi:hypothetical protein